jgi:hypothetical protein
MAEPWSSIAIALACSMSSFGDACLPADGWISMIVTKLVG